MSSQDTMFLVQIAVEELRLFTSAKNYRINVRFGDIFKLKLRDPNELAAEATKTRLGGKKKRKIKSRQGIEALPPKTVPSVKTAIVVSDVESLLKSMLNYPLEVSLYSKDDPFVLGVAEIAWSDKYMDFVRNIEQDPYQSPATSTEIYKTYDEYTSKRVANVKMKIQLCLLEDTRPTQIHRTYGNLGRINQDSDLTQKVSKQEPALEERAFEPGMIKTIYHGGRQKKIKQEHKDKNPEVDSIANNKESNNTISELERDSDFKTDLSKTITDTSKNNTPNIFQSHHSSNSKYSLNNCNKKNDKSITSLIRSQTQLQQGNLFAMKKHWSCSSVEIKERLDTLNYIFGNLDASYGNQIYCVGYFTVENTGTGGGSPPKKPVASPDKTLSEKTSKAGSMTSGQPNAVSDAELKKCTFNICADKCPFGANNTCFENVCELDLPESARKMIEMKKCSNLACYYRKQGPVMEDPKDPILVDFGTSCATKDCCVEKVEEVVGGIAAKLTKDPCLCTCECSFGFIKRTTYCKVCGGYEVAGDEMKSTRGGPPFPCPIYHGLVKNKKGRGALSSKESGSQGAGTATRSKTNNNNTTNTNNNEDNVTIPRKKHYRDPRFKFNYGYKAPQIGHSQCAMPCSGGLHPVPKRMGWLWTANNIPGLKVRPGYRPGAANKHVVRMLRIARFPEEELSRRKKKDSGKKKRPLKRPLLTVQKKDGEYHVTMETMKTFTKSRLVNQYPYEDKPLVCFTVGRTDEENAERQKRKERAQRRLEREQRAFLKSAFQDMCKEICLKTYEQALGLLPFADDSFCPCYPELPPPDRVDSSHSCSCTESERSSGSATDDDEWIVEFTPPNAYFNPARNVKKIHTMDQYSQYDYLDYRVKLYDVLGNEVPRFFIGPVGKKECSDLGGFWGPDGKWLEINEDGVIGPDGRWAPNSFIGPCGEQVDAEHGRFQTSNGVWLTCGLDGYVDKGKWRFYSKQKSSKDPKKQRNIEEWIKAGGCKGAGEKGYPLKFSGGNRKKYSETTWSCFGDASPKTLSQMGIAGHGHDRLLLLSTLEKLMKQGEDVKLPHRPDIPKCPGKPKKFKKKNYDAIFAERAKCRHRQAPSKGIVAVSDRGHKTYFQLKDYKNVRPKQRMQMLDEEGFILSSFHVPCFSSFVNSEVARQQQLEHILQHNARVMESAVQTG